MGRAELIQHFVLPEPSPAIQSSDFHTASNPAWWIFHKKSYFGTNCGHVVSPDRFCCVRSRARVMFVHAGSSKFIFSAGISGFFPCKPPVPALLLEHYETWPGACRFPLGVDELFQEKSGYGEFPDKLWENFTPKGVGKSRGCAAHPGTSREWDTAPNSSGLAQLPSGRNRTGIFPNKNFRMSQKP